MSNRQQDTTIDGTWAPTKLRLCEPAKIDLLQTTFKSSPSVTYGSKTTVSSKSAYAESTCIDSEEFHIIVKPATRFFDGETKCLIPAYSTHSINRGHVLIVNIINYKSGQTRKGAEIDGRNLQELFVQMGLRVEMYNDLTGAEMRQAIVNFRSNPHLENTDMTFVILMGYGYDVNKASVIIGTDNTYITTKWVEEQFNYANCKALHKKPKMFIYQASRGPLQDFGVLPLMEVYIPPRTLPDKHTEMDSPSQLNLITLESVVDAQTTLDDQHTYMQLHSSAVLRQREDMLVVYSTLPGYASYRDIDEGTWYIQTFCKVMMNYAHVHHLEEIFKVVDYQLATRQSSEGCMQTSTFTTFGFNNHCYMHPTIYLKDREIRNINDDLVVL